MKPNIQNIIFGKALDILSNSIAMHSMMNSNISIMAAFKVTVVTWLKK